MLQLQSIKKTSWSLKKLVSKPVFFFFMEGLRTGFPEIEIFYPVEPEQANFEKSLEQLMLTKF